MLALAVLLLTSPFLLPAQSPATCPDVAACRQAALEAAERRDFETFHDLAWLAARKGRPNDPGLMYLLARAQSLSGRPGDALVMLRRIAQLGVKTDAAESDDFLRVRALPGWAELAAFIAAAETTAVPPAAEAPPVLTPPVAAGETAIKPPEAAAARARPNRPAPAASRRPAPVESPSPVPPPVPVAEAPAAAPDGAAPVAPAAAGGEEAVSLNGGLVDPVGLAYDSASRRFVVGDRRANKLVVADEVFRRVNDLIGAASGGFGTLTAIEIDGRRGDLWAASTNADGAASVHKLQLVSGRVLATVPLPDTAGPARLTDMLMADAGSLLILESEGARLWTLRTGTQGFSSPVPIDVPASTSIAPAGAATYVAHQQGLARFEGKPGRPVEVKAAPGVVLTGLRRIRWTRGGLIALQTDAGGSDRLVRIRLAGQGQRATAVEPLDALLAAEGPALTISRDAAYYVARTDAGPVIRRVPLP